MHRIRLAERAERHELVMARRGYDLGEMEPIVTVIASPEQTGEAVSLVEAGKTAVKGSLSIDDSGRAVAHLVPSVSTAMREESRLLIVLGDVSVSEVALPAAVAHIPQLLKRREELRERFGIDRPWDDMAEASALIQRHRGMVADALRWIEKGSPPSGDDLLAGLSRATEMLLALDEGEDYLGGRRNEFWSAYYSPADGSGQVFVAIVPADFDIAKRYPLVVQLHGYGELPKPKFDLVHEGLQHLEVWPLGRGNNGYTDLGEDDVLRIIEYMKRWYPVDAERVYLTGRSMGGYGAWRLSALYPDIFAAVAPFYGGASDTPLENLLHVPVFNQHGARDWLVPIDLSRFAVNRLQKLNYAVIHKEYPEAGHNVPEYDIREWFNQFRRPGAPAAVTYTCEVPGGAYWLNVRQFVDPHLPARVTARVAGFGEKQMLTLLAPNVAVLEFDVGGMPIDRNAGLLVQMGETFLELGEPLPERLFAVQGEDGWRVLDNWSPAPSAVRPYRSGAAANLYDGEPLMIVYGTRGGTERTQMLRSAAEVLSCCSGGDGEAMPVGEFPVKGDSEVRKDDLEQFNLVLLGSAGDNALVARMLGKLPVEIDGKNWLLAGGREPVSLEGAGIRLHCYNPLAPQRLIFWVGTDAEGEGVGEWLADSYQIMTGTDGRVRPDQPDLVVQTVGGPDRRRMQFTHGWQWRRVEGADRPAPERLADSREMARVRLRVVRRTAGADFAFDFGIEAGRREYEPRWFTLADMAVARTPGQILVASVSGEELIDIHRRWVADEGICVEPVYAPGDIDPQRIYRIAMHPDVCHQLAGREKTLSDVVAGPDWRAEDLWAEIFE